VKKGLVVAVVAWVLITAFLTPTAFAQGENPWSGERCCFVVKVTLNGTPIYQYDGANYPIGVPLREAHLGTSGRSLSYQTEAGSGPVTIIIPSELAVQVWYHRYESAEHRFLLVFVIKQDEWVPKYEWINPGENQAHFSSKPYQSNDAMQAGLQQAQSAATSGQPSTAQSAPAAQPQQNTVQTAPAAVPTASTCRTYYTVQWGDGLYRIAERFGTTATAISDANGIADLNKIRAGQNLCIP